MKIQQINNLELKSIGDITTVESTISADSLPFIFDMLSKSFYSDALGSMIREITSNCLDAHTEAGVNEPIIIKKSYNVEEDAFYLSFIDYGTGLSPDKINTVYMSWFTSTKRDSNEYIGAFGLGSKSPLAYQDYFYIITNVDGIRYTYVFSKGESKPSLDLLDQCETTSRNGTEIKVQIKNSDLGTKLETKFKEQLSYFDNIYFVGFDNSYNNFTIFNKNTFKYRKNVSNTLHILLGNVTYYVDWKTLGRKEIEIGIGVKFNIGELLVIPNREQVRYTPEVIELVNKKIDAALEEINDLYDNEEKGTDDFGKYLKLKDSKLFINFDADNRLYVNNTYLTKYQKGYQFLPLAHLPINIPQNPFDSLYSNTTVIFNKGKYHISIGAEKENIYKHKYIGGTTLVRQNKTNLDLIGRTIGLYYYGNRETYCGITNAYSKYDNKKVEFILRNSEKVKRIHKQVPLLGKAKIIKEYVDFIRNYVYTNSQGFYKDIIVPDEFIKQCKKEEKESSLAYLRKINGQIPVVVNGSRSSMYIKDLIKTNLVVYGFKEDKELLQTCRDLYELKKSYYNRKRNTSFLNSKAIIIIQISKENEKILKEFSNTMYIEKWFIPNDKNKKLFKNLATALIIKEKWYFSREIIKLTKSINSNIYAKLRDLEYFVNSTTPNINDINKELSELLLSISSEYNLINHLVLSLTKELDNYFNGLQILKHLNNYNTDEYYRGVADFIISKGKKVNYIYYKTEEDRLSLQNNNIQLNTENKINLKQLEMFVL